MKIISFENKYRDDLIFMILEAKNALGKPKEQWFESWQIYPKIGYREYEYGKMKKKL